MTRLTHTIIALALVASTAGPAGAEWARYDTTTRRLLHWSVPAFTTPTPAGQTDRQFPAGTGLPGPVSQLRLTTGLSSLEIDPALVPVIEDGEALRKSLGSIFAGTPAEKKMRWGAVLEKYPAATAFFSLLRPPLTADGKATLSELAGRIKARIGDPVTEVLTQAEYDALKALATSHNLGGLIP